METESIFTMGNIFLVLGGLAFLVFAIVALVSTFFTVDTNTVAVVQRLGKFKNIASAGLNLKVPFIDKVEGRVSLRVQQLNVDVETKTKDNVFVKAVVAVQYFVSPENVYNAFYKLSNPKRQIESYVFDAVRAEVPKMDLDEVFDNKDQISDTVKSELGEAMNDYGYGIVKSLVTDIDPDSKVKDSMNEINAARRLRVAAEEKGEADKILEVKKAEAEAEAKKLQGEGIANQRQAIIHGLQSSVAEFKEAVEGADAMTVMQLVLMTQYFDTIKEVGSNSGANTIMMPHSPGGMSDIMTQFQQALLTTTTTRKDS